MRRVFAGGIAWSDARQALFELVNKEPCEVREQYQRLIADSRPLRQTELMKGAKNPRDRQPDYG